MTCRLTAALLLLLLASSPVRADETDADPARSFHLSATDLNGRRQAVGSEAGTRCSVVVFLSTGCPISNQSLVTLKELSAAFTDGSAQVIGVYASADGTATDLREEVEKRGLNFPVVRDGAGRWQQTLGATHSPEAFVVDAAGRLRYRGQVDDRYADVGQRRPAVTRNYVREAVDAVLAGKSPATSSTTPVGCPLPELTVATGTADVTYHRDVLPLLQQHCQDCHRPGQVAPFSLLTYEETARRAKAIGQAVTRRLMPPWKPTDHGVELRGTRRLTDSEVKTLETWIAAGAPEGSPDDAPPARVFPKDWRLGPPDLVVEMPESVLVPAEADDFYRYIVVPVELPADQGVVAVEFQPGAPQVVHHASFMTDTNGRARLLDAADPLPGYESATGPQFEATSTLGGWAAGVTPQVLPPGIARRLPAKCDLVLQVHYHPSGRRSMDRSRLGLYFSKTPVRQWIAEIPVANLQLKIPSGAAVHEHVATYTPLVDTELWGMAPHAHHLCRSMTAEATLPDGQVIPLITIDDWDFNWQDHYRLREPLKLPGGTTIRTVTTYDNSPSNVRYPQKSPKEVGWGLETKDEMGVIFFDLTTETPEQMQLLKSHRAWTLNN